MKSLKKFKVKRSVIGKKLIFKTLSIFFTLLLFAACSTSKHELHDRGMIDSERRGIEIYNTDRELLGKTPLYYNYSKSRQHQLYYKIGDTLMPLEITCDRYGNFLFGYFFDCPNYFLISNEDYHLHESKKVSLLFVPPRPDWEIPNEIKTKIQKEYIIVKDKNLNEKLSSYGAYPQTLNEVINEPSIYEDHLKDNDINFLIFFFPIEGEENKYTPQIIEKEKFSIIENYTTTADTIETGLLESVLGLFNFFPNSLSVNYFFQGRVTTEFDGRKVKSDKRDVKRQSDILPTFLPIITAETVIFPYKYENSLWKFNFSPSINSYSFKYTDNLDDNFYILELESYGLYYNFNSNLILSNFVFTLSIGLGLKYESIQDTQGFVRNDLDLGTKTSFISTLFFNKRYFGQIGFNAYSLNGELQEQGLYRPEQYTEYFVSFGYYFPELKFL